jgi:hypothetical protein
LGSARKWDGLLDFNVKAPLAVRSAVVLGLLPPRKLLGVDTSDSGICSLSFVAFLNFVAFLRCGESRRGPFTKKMRTHKDLVVLYDFFQK